MIVELSVTKAYSIESIEIREQRLVSIRQMYRSKGDPEWKPARQGITIPVEIAEEMARKIRVVARRDPKRFKKIDL